MAERGLLVTNAKGVYAVPIAEYVSGMVLRVNQPAATWSADQAAHRWPDGTPALVSIVRGRTAVVAGYGSIGREVARQLAALGMRILAVKRRPGRAARHVVPGPGDGRPGRLDPRADRRRGGARRGRARGGRAGRDDAADRRLARDRRAATSLAALPPRAWLINVSRGPLVDEPALLEALRAGRLAGAVLDVFGEEPLPPDSPWWDAPNVIVTPHASGHTLRFFDELVVENVRRYLAGEPLLNPVDPERGY